MSPSITPLSHQCLHPLHYYISILIPLFHQCLHHYTIISRYLYHCLSKSFIFLQHYLSIVTCTLLSLWCVHPLHHCISIHYTIVCHTISPSLFITLSIEPLVPVVVLCTTCILIYIAPPNVPTNFTATTMKISSTSGPKGQVSVSRPQPPPTVNRPQRPPC